MSDAVALTIVSTIPSIILSIASLVKSFRTDKDVEKLNTRMDACEKCQEESGITDEILFHEHMAAVHLKASMTVRTPDDMPARRENTA